MKITGIILLVIGIISTFAVAVMGRGATLSGLIFVILGAFLISRANKKAEEEKKKKEWAEGKALDE